MTHKSYERGYAPQLVKEHIKQEKIKTKQQYDKTTNERTFKIGDKAYYRKPLEKDLKN